MLTDFFSLTTNVLTEGVEGSWHSSVFCTVRQIPLVFITSLQAAGHTSEGQKGMS